MNQEIEIEFKNMLTKEEFTRLKEYFSINDDAFSHQENHYFDTSGFALKEKRSALRIRKKKGSYEMTLKQPLETGLLETNEVLSESEADKMMLENRIPEGPISGILEQDLGIKPDEVLYFGSLSTERAQFPYQGGLLVLDHSRYLGTEDFELEYEVQQYGEGKKHFENLLREVNIPLRKTDNKIKRFYKQKYNDGNE